MFKNLVKIANKLDSLGLTKEADVLDRYIAKVAGIYQDSIKNPPPEWAQEAFKKWLTTKSAFNKTYEVGGKSGSGAIVSFIPVSSYDTSAAAYAEIIGMSAFVRKELQRDNGLDLFTWHNDNIRSPGFIDPYGSVSSVLSNDLRDLARKIEDVVKGGTPPKVAPLYNELVSHLKGTADLWEGRSEGQPKAPASSPSAPTKSEPQIAMESSTTYPPTAPKPAAPQDPWSKVSKDLRKAWLDRAADRKKDPSYSNYQAWLRSKNMIGATEDAIKAALRMDMITGGKKKDYEFTAAEAGPITPGFGLADVERQRVK